MPDTKERIKRRMIQLASKLWGYKGTQPEESFDPIVGLLMGAYAAELEKIHHEIADSETRIIERLVNIFTPHPIISVKPSHAVAYAYPEKSRVEINTDMLFYVNKKTGGMMKNKKNEKQVFFTPTINTTLISAYVKYVAFGDKVFEYVEQNFKDPVMYSDGKKQLSKNRLWVALKVEELKTLPEYFTFHFNVNGVDLKNQFLNKELSNAKWSVANRELKVHPGLMFQEKNKKSRAESVVDNHANTTSKLLNHVNSFYSKEFRTAMIGVDNAGDEMKNAFPELFSSVFAIKDVEKLENEHLLWVEIWFAQSLTNETVENLNVSINCFPVINRKLNEFSSSARKLLNIIPLQTDDLFLDINAVIDKNGNPYRINLYSNVNELENGHAILRYGGVNRYDSRDAKQHIDYLLELLKDESTAFNILGNDMISTDLRHLEQAIARLEKKVQEINLIQSETNYLLLKPHEKNDLVYVEFWSCDGVFANGIRSGSSLLVYRGKDVKADSLKLILSTQGGKNKPASSEIINIYRKALLTKGKLVTEADYKFMVFEYLGEEVELVEIKKGTMNDSSVNNGMIRTIDIFIQLKDSHPFTKEELGFIHRDLLINLQQNSANIFPYRIFFN